MKLSIRSCISLSISRLFVSEKVFIFCLCLLICSSVSCVYIYLKIPYRFYLVFCNPQRYEIVNGTTEDELAPEDTKVDQGDEKTAEGNFMDTVSSLFVFNHFGKIKYNITCFNVFHRRERSSKFLAHSPEK